LLREVRSHCYATIFSHAQALFLFVLSVVRNCR
jgi:hypothetical protein